MTGATEYIINVYEDAGLETEFIGSPFTTSNISYTATGLDSSTQYWFVVDATNGAITSSGCSYVTGTTEAIVVPCPVVTLGAVTGSFGNISFTTDELAEQYTCVLYNDAGGTSVNQTETITVTEVGTPEAIVKTFSGLSSATQYWYRVTPLVGGTAANTCGLGTFTTS